MSAARKRPPLAAVPDAPPEKDSPLWSLLHQQPEWAPQVIELALRGLMAEIDDHRPDHDDLVRLVEPIHALAYDARCYAERLPKP